MADHQLCTRYVLDAWNGKTDQQFCLVTPGRDSKLNELSFLTVREIQRHIWTKIHLIGSVLLVHCRLFPLVSLDMAWRQVIEI